MSTSRRRAGPLRLLSVEPSPHLGFGCGGYDAFSVHGNIFAERSQATGNDVRVAFSDLGDVTLLLDKADFGLDIRADIQGVSRPNGTSWDLGAFESAR
ncbi:MAG: hypothetical protein JKY37_25555 [Nannocystaceae bacterium]|nr:hypothetical protein [Nannocystaceae bacterium]